jgi:hypothetical protein
MSVGQSVLVSGAHNQSFITVRQLWACWCGAPSLTGGRVCSLQLILVLVSAIIIGSESRGTQWPYFGVSDSRLLQPEGPGPHIYIPQEQNCSVSPSGTGSPFRRLLLLAGLWWRYSNPLPHGAGRHTRGSKVEVKIMLRLTVSQSVCLGVETILELVTTYYFLSESCCVVSVGRPLVREVGSVSCQSLSALFSPLTKFNFIYLLHVTHVLFIYNIYKASVSQRSVQQIMPHHL